MTKDYLQLLKSALGLWQLAVCATPVPLKMYLNYNLKASMDSVM